MQVVGLDQLQNVFASSDFIVVTLALTNETKKLIDQSCFNHSKPGQVFINIARGAVVDEEVRAESQ
jgi:phosphoglycerate dehydrogenase-like enzyme